MKPVMLTGFALDDWGAVLTVNSLLPLTIDRLFHFSWSYLGIHHTMQFFYIGVLFSFLKFDYPAYNIPNIIFKIIATLSLFPLILLVFKKKSLAFLTTIIYAASYSATGALTYILQGVYYIGITFMNIFFIFYYYSVTKSSKLHLFLASISLILAYWFAPGRIYPILAFIFLIELFLNLKYGFKTTVIKSIVRLVFFYLPIILLILTGKKDYSQLGTPSQTFQDVLSGNWRVALNPLSGLGYLFLPSDYWRIFGVLNLEKFGDFLNFLIRENFLIFMPLTLFLAFIVSKSVFKFSISVLLINFISSVLIFLMATHHLNIPVDLRVGWDEGVFWKQQYYSLFGLYILIISSACFWTYWKSNQKKDSGPLLAMVIGPIFAFIFLFGLWLILGRVMTFYGGVSRYFPFASLGGSLFIGGILVLVLDSVSKKNAAIKTIAKSVVFFIIFFIFQISSKEIDIGFRGINIRNAYLHKQFQESFIRELPRGEITDKRSVLFYFDLPDETRQEFEQAFDSYNFSRWMYLRLGNTEEKCLGVITDKSKLVEAVKIDGQALVLIHPNSGCIGKWDRISAFQEDRRVIYKPEDFYAFRISGDNFINITDEVLQKLQPE